mgnify:CR=1 FL=1
MCLTAGEKLLWVSAQTGQKDWGFTARTYSKFIDYDQARAGGKIGDFAEREIDKPRMNSVIVLEKKEECAN